jgi:putative two-component system response regulator
MDPQIQVHYEREINLPFKDSLSGLFNHGLFQIALDKEVKRAERHGESFALALIDIDSFSAFNRHYGHMQGDRILKKVAGLIQDNIRQADLAARYSGDVFAVILTKSSIQSALVAAERIRQAVEMSCGGPTVSVGLSSYPRDSSDREGLIKKAQKSLLQAKTSGKNRVHFFEKDNKPAAEATSRILVVDDEPLNAKLLEALLAPMNYEVIKAFNGEEALSLVSKVDVDLVLLDIMMPGLDGYEVCQHLKASEATRLIPIVMVTALDDIEAKIKGIEVGADDFLTKPPNKVELLARIRSLINVKSLNDRLANFENVLFSLAGAVEAKDAYTQGHIQRVANMAVALARKMGLSKSEIESVRVGGILHDIGKIGVSRTILNKREPLTAQEQELMKAHTDVGYKICLPLKKNLGPALEVIRSHHEKLDGSGYPDGLKGEQISTVARVMTVVDIYDALVTDRPYRKRMAKEKALHILRQEAKEGKLDQKVIEALMELVSRGEIDDCEQDGFGD